MDEQQINENKTLSDDDIACPNCGSHNVRCVPYPKVEFGAWFILWLGEPMPPKAARKFFKCCPDFDAITDKLKYLLLSAHSRSRKSYEYSEKLVNGLKILSLIRKRPGISTQTLTELTELPLRNVQRYISALQATGEWIEYDRSLRGWKLFHGFSILYGDVWEEDAE